MTITCSGCDKPLPIEFELTDRHTVIYCVECLAKACAVCMELSKPMTKPELRAAIKKIGRDEIERQRRIELP